MSPRSRRAAGALASLALVLALVLSGAGAAGASLTSGNVETSTVTQAPSPEAEKLEIPEDLIGENAAIVDDELRRLGFTNIEYGSADADHRVVIVLANWTVVDISPTPGKEVPPDALVVLTCSKQR